MYDTITFTYYYPQTARNRVVDRREAYCEGMLPCRLGLVCITLSGSYTTYIADARSGGDISYALLYIVQVRGVTLLVCTSYLLSASMKGLTECLLELQRFEINVLAF